MDATLIDLAEEIRRALLIEINSAPAERLELAARHGRVWNPAELAADFEVLQFHAPVVVARRQSDQRMGSLFFQHHPRYYFAFREDR